MESQSQLLLIAGVVCLIAAIVGGGVSYKDVTIPKILSQQRHTIVPRAANSKTLVEQSVGRGLRLPCGRRTSVFAVDRLNIISHDRFDEIINAANDPNSIIRAKVVIGRDIPDKAQKTVQVESKLAAALTSFDSSAASAQSLFASDEERTAARDVLRVLENAPRALRTADLSRPEVQQEIVDRLRPEVSVSQGVLADGTGNVLDLAAAVKDCWLNRQPDD